MSSAFENLRILVMLLPTLALAQGCLEQDTTGDTTELQMARQRDSARQVALKYAQITGQFAGVYEASNVLLTLDVARATGPGPGDLATVPQPTLVGSLTLTPQVFMTNTGAAMPFPYPVTSGSYLGDDDLTLSVQQGGSPTVFHCKVAGHASLLCNWYLNASTAPRARFKLTRVAEGEAPLVSGHDRFDGVYAGANANYAKITAEFRTVLVPQAGSVGVPQVAIAGSFLLAGATHDQLPGGNKPASPNFNFLNGEFDPISSTIAISMQGDSSSMIVNCRILSVTTLHCTWVGTYGGLTSSEDFDLQKVN